MACVRPTTAEENYDVAEIIATAESLKNVISVSTKKVIVQGVRKVFAMDKMQGIDLFKRTSKEIIKELSKELIKTGWKFFIDHSHLLS